MVEPNGRDVHPCAGAERGRGVVAEARIRDHRGVQTRGVELGSRRAARRSRGFA